MKTSNMTLGCMLAFRLGDGTGAGLIDNELFGRAQNNRKNGFNA